MQPFAEPDRSAFEAGLFQEAAAPAWPKPYDPRTSTLPLAGVTSGMLASCMNYDKLPRSSSLAPHPPPSPLQQWIESGHHEHAGPVGYEIGQPVRICHLISPECVPYNGLIGDIIMVHEIEREDHTFELAFDVRCVLEADDSRLPQNIIRDESYGSRPASDYARRAAPANRAQVAPLYGLMANVQEEDECCLPPFLLLSRLPSEKLEPLSTPNSAPQGVLRIHSLPPQVRPPIWGEPLPPVVVATRPPIPEHMSKAPAPRAPAGQRPPTFSFGAPPNQ